jgi:hypothetical protein
MEKSGEPTLQELTERLNASHSRMEAAYAATAVTNLAFAVTYAARFALGCGCDRETVVLILEGLAAAVRNPGEVAEDMSPIPYDDF